MLANLQGCCGQALAMLHAQQWCWFNVLVYVFVVL